MNNKKAILIGVIIVLIVAIVAIVLVFVQKTPNTNNDAAGNNENSQVVVPIDTENMTVAEIEAIPVTEENIFVIKEDGSFSPKEMTAKYGERLWITLKAEGTGSHVIQSDDPVMGELLLILVNGGEEPKSVAFPVPEPGEYSFYVDAKDNTGVIKVTR